MSFDDLLGYPVPNDARDGLQYLRTPATLWGAQSVFLDEISRCRPEVQNKLFSIVHERRAMGIELDALRYRWAAMNPPAAFDDAGDLDDTYLGSQPLDPALADRFAFVVALTALADIAPEQRRLLIARGDDAPAHGNQSPAGDGSLAALIAAARSRVALSIESYDAWVTGYVDALVATLTSVVFQGPVLRCEATTKLGTTLVAHVHVDDMPEGARMGHPIILSWMPGAAHVVNEKIDSSQAGATKIDEDETAEAS